MLDDLPYSKEVTQKEWDRAGKRTPAISVQLALEMTKGQILKIHHPDVFCDGHQCSLRSALSKRKDGKWQFSHTKPRDALVRRKE